MRLDLFAGSPFEPIDLAPQEAQVLLALAQRPRTPRQLAEELGFPRLVINSLLQGLLARKLTEVGAERQDGTRVECVHQIHSEANSVAELLRSLENSAAAAMRLAPLRVPMHRKAEVVERLSQLQAELEATEAGSSVAPHFLVWIVESG